MPILNRFNFLIARWIVSKPKKLRDWVRLERLDSGNLSLNPCAVDLLEENPNMINWFCLSLNPSAIHLLEKNQDKIWWEQLSQNPSAISLLKKNYNKIDWMLLSKNPAGICLIENRMKCFYAQVINIIDCFSIHILLFCIHITFLLISSYDIIKIYNYLHFIVVIHVFIYSVFFSDWADWELLSANPAAISLLKKYPEKIDWCCLSRNPAAISLLEKNPNKIDWYELSENPAAISLLEKNPDKISFKITKNPAAISLLNKYRISTNWLSSNPAAINLLEKNQTNINWKLLSRNPAIFEENNQLSEFKKKCEGWIRKYGDHTPRKMF